MTRKETIDLLLSKVPEDKKGAFVSEIRGAKTGEDRASIISKYAAKLTKDELKAIKEGKMSSAISDEELDNAAGGCCSCSLPCPGVCSMYCACT